MIVRNQKWLFFSIIIFIVIFFVPVLGSCESSDSTFLVGSWIVAPRQFDTTRGCTSNYCCGWQLYLRNDGSGWIAAVDYEKTGFGPLNNAWYFVESITPRPYNITWNYTQGYLFVDGPEVDPLTFPADINDMYVGQIEGANGGVNEIRLMKTITPFNESAAFFECLPGRTETSPCTSVPEPTTLLMLVEELHSM